MRPSIKRTSCAALAAVALLPGGVGRAKADFITDLYDTGVVTNGTPATGGDFDQHYTMAPNLGSPYVSSSIPASYLANGPNSQWIGIDPNLDPAFKVSKLHDYQTTSAIGAGYDPTTATISGSIGSNDSIEIFLNGVDMGVGAVAPAWLPTLQNQLQFDAAACEADEPTPSLIPPGSLSCKHRPGARSTRPQRRPVRQS
jgi:hypothetical protein